MKKSVFFIMILGAIAIAMGAQGQVTYTVTFSSNDLSFESVSASDGNTYSQVLLSGVTGNTTEAGKPKLPLRTLHLMIPFGKKVTSVVCSNISTQSFQLSHDVYPAPIHDVSGQVFATPDTLVYQSSSPFPAQPIMGWYQDYFDGNNNILTIGLCPFEYYPKTGLMNLITSVTITATFIDGMQGGITQIQRLQTTQNLYDSILYHLVDNPEVIPTFQIAPTIVDELGYTATNLPVYEYVVIAPRNLIGALHSFVTWKNQKGYRTGVVAIEDILTEYPNGDQIWSGEDVHHAIVDDAGSLRQYLYDAHALGTSFALFVGDASVMPIRYGGQVNPGIFPQVPTDMYFSDLHGNWNVNHNALYGELEENTDTPSKYADIFVGRLLCSESELMLVDSLAVYGVGTAQAMSKSILEANGIATEVNCPQILLHEIAEGRGGNVVLDTDYANGFEVVIKPNPSTTWFSVDYQLPKDVIEASLTLQNSLGVVVIQDTLYDNKGQKVFDTSALAKGLYIYSIECNGFSKKGKLIITK